MPQLALLRIGLYGAGPYMGYLWQTTLQPPKVCYSLPFLGRVDQNYIRYMGSRKFLIQTFVILYIKDKILFDFNLLTAGSDHTGD